MKLCHISRQQYLEGLNDEISDHGLRGSIKKRLDQIDQHCANLKYLDHRLIQELCSEINDLLTVYAEGRQHP